MNDQEQKREDSDPHPNADVRAAMRLRADPPRVTRLSRKVLAGVGFIALLGIGGALIYALQAPDRNGEGEELFSTENRNTADGLSTLPSDYTGPVLGPPLPGDLGRPILKAQERGQPVVPPAIRTPTLNEQEQRRLAEEEAARISRVFFQTGQAALGGAGVGAVPPISSSVPGGVAAQDGNTAFLNASVDRRITASDRATAPASPYVLQAGSVIPAALITGIRSDLPGQITAQVTQHVYDSSTGRLLLIPQGTRIIGEYSNDVGFGQRRVLFVWTRLIFPNGRSIVLERQPGADTLGHAGLEDGVDYHWWDLAKAAGLSTLLSVGAELAVSDDDRLVQAIREGVQDTIDDAGQQIVQRQLQVAPTLTIRPGFPVRVIVTRDLMLEPHGG